MNGLDETSNEKSAGFDIVHREVYEEGMHQVRVDLVIPGGFSKDVLDIQEGQIARVPGLSYHYMKYPRLLKDRSIGLQRANLVLKGTAGQTLVETPLVWQRLAFLASAPDRVSFSTRPVQVFLRCPDDSVELTRVVSTPDGIKFELDSPRSIRVTLS